MTDYKEKRVLATIHRPLADFVASRGEVVKPFAEADRAMQEERVGRGEIKQVKYGKTNEYLHPEATGPMRKPCKCWS